MFGKVTVEITENIKIAEYIYRMELDCGGADIAHFVPGQFANLKIPGHDELLLRRPISICAVDAEKNTVTLVYQIVGKGTDALSQLQKGTKTDAILPVGKGFNLKTGDKTVFLVGGGVGIAPLLSVTQRWPDKNYEAFLGYRGARYEYCLDHFKKVCGNVFATSDDGTLGEQGLVTAPLARRLEQVKPDIVLICGPTPMLKAVREITKPLEIPAQSSMEQRMCCGFGACATCVCGVNTSEGLEYKKVCVEGPVFDLYEVAL